MARERLPNRRESTIHRIEHLTPEGGAFVLEVAVAHFSDGRVAECFITSPGTKTGSALAVILNDAAIIVSLFLQHGGRIDDLAKSLGRHDNRAPVSPLGAVVDLALEIEFEVMRPGRFPDCDSEGEGE